MYEEFVGWKRDRTDYIVFAVENDDDDFTFYHIFFFFTKYNSVTSKTCHFKLLDVIQKHVNFSQVFVTFPFALDSSIFGWPSVWGFFLLLSFH